MKDICFIFLFLFSSLSSSYAQLVGFEESVPQTFKVAGKGELKTSSLFYKEGKSSLEWDFQPGSTLDVRLSLVGSEMCIRDREKVVWNGTFSRGQHWTFKCPLYL